MANRAREVLLHSALHWGGSIWSSGPSVGLSCCQRAGLQSEHNSKQFLPFQCYLTCHKKCLENLLITCGHKKLPNRAPLFGIDFTQVPRDFPEEVPFIVVKCTSEIEARALGVQGIYRISGSKARVEKLCQAFENGRSLVELSEHSPHDITGVLKHFLKELSGPILLYQLYDNLIALAKELQKAGEEKVDCMSFPSDPIQSMKDLLSKLPGSNYNTLRHLIAHLYR
ncbi:GEM-interacting protein-like [Phasianus colchicus]|uniref:GEM-interacting protein-like n=1 Tax=Phasianus colchicus TaxID=9054 RepID=UPI00129DB197|nr:GEM-interacting protein-like [Phasianus colchicus]